MLLGMSTGEIIALAGVIVGAVGVMIQTFFAIRKRLRESRHAAEEQAAKGGALLVTIRESWRRVQMPVILRADPRRGPTGPPPDVGHHHQVVVQIVNVSPMPITIRSLIVLNKKGQRHTVQSLVGEALPRKIDGHESVDLEFAPQKVLGYPWTGYWVIVIDTLGNEFKSNKHTLESAPPKDERQ